MHLPLKKRKSTFRCHFFFFSAFHDFTVKQSPFADPVCHSAYLVCREVIDPERVSCLIFIFLPKRVLDIQMEPYKR